MNESLRRTERQPLLSIAEAARALNVSRSTINRVIAAGELRIVKIGDRTLVRPDDLETLIERSLRQR